MTLSERSTVAMVKSSRWTPWNDMGGKRRYVGWVAVVAVLSGAAGWSLHSMLRPAPDVLESPSFAVVEAREATVGQSVRLNVTAEWLAAEAAANHSAGTVTSLDVVPGAEVESGEAVYAVNLRHVVVAAGSVPAFRELTRGDQGEDVAQLQSMLREVGYLAAEPDGRFGAETYLAVRAWQRELGVTVDGVVRHGDVIFVKELPARLGLVDELAVGTVLAGGELVLNVLQGEPSFVVSLPEGHARLVMTGMEVVIDVGGIGPWHAEIVEIVDHEVDGRIAILSGRNGDSICGDDCSEIPSGDAVLLPSLIHVVPEVSGVAVPAAAVVTTADGLTSVVLESEEIRTVTVVSTGEGLAIVEGVEPGERVRVPGEMPGSSLREGR